MAVRVFITIDTEEDFWGEYGVQNPPVDNVASIPKIQELFDRYGAIPTYLVNYPVVRDQHARNILAEILQRGRCEIGTHCHPWNTPPFEEEISSQSSMLSNLPLEITYKKLKVLHEEIIRKFKIEPKSFRAGRYGFGSAVAECIAELGYKIDSSVTPLTDWTDAYGPDFYQAPYFPYRFDPPDILCKKENGGLLEVPVSIGFTKNGLNIDGHVLKWILEMNLPRLHLVGILDRLGILSHRWLSPEKSSGRDMILLAKNLIHQGCRYLNMTFHSTSLLPGKSPFVHDQGELENFLKDIETFLVFAQKAGMEFMPLSGSLEILDGEKRNHH